MTAQEQGRSTREASKALSAAEGKWRCRLLRAAAVLAVVVVAGLVAAVAVTAFDGFQYDSDVLYLPALYHDLASGVPIGHWRLPAVAGFFPDMPLMFGLLLATSQDAQLAIVLYGVAIMLLLGAATAYVISAVIKLRWWSVFLVYAALYLWLTVILAGADGVMLLRFSLIPSLHAGLLVSGMLFLGLTLRLFRRPVSKVVCALWVLISAATAAGDAFFLVHYFAPAAICLYVFRRGAKFPDGPSLLRIVALVVCTVVVLVGGLAIAERFVMLGSAASGKISLQLKPLAPLFSRTRVVLGPLAKANPAAALVSLAAVALAAVIAVRYLWVTYASGAKAAVSAPPERNRNGHFCMLLFVLSAAATVLFPTLVNYPPRWEASIVRYFQPIYIHPAIILALCACWLLAGSRQRLRAIVVGAVVVACVAVTVVRGRAILPKDPFATPQLVGFLNRLHRATGVECGLGSFWLAKPSRLLPGSPVRVDAAWYPWAAYRHVSNLEWYMVTDGSGRKRLRTYEFIVPYESFPEDVIISKFGPPADVYEDPSGLVEPGAGVYEGQAPRALIYNRPGDVAFRNYLYIPALAAMRMSPPSLILRPGNLQQYKADGTKRDAGGCTAVPVGDELTVTFSSPAAGDVLEICAAGDSQFEVHVHYTDGRSETLYIGAVRQEGLARRIMGLREAGPDSGIARIGLKAAAGNDGECIVGHVYVFRDNR